MSREHTILNAIDSCQSKDEFYKVAEWLRTLSLTEDEKFIINMHIENKAYDLLYNPSMKNYMDFVKFLEMEGILC